MTTSKIKEFNLSCPMPLDRYPKILMAHGGGGKLMHDLIEKMIAPAFANTAYQGNSDSAVLSVPPGRLAFTTDSFVVRPLFFPGGDIGKLAIHGTVNDLAMSGARPLYISVGFILEEGLPMETLWKILQSMRQAAEEAGVHIVTGDTKVVDKGKGDGIFINTSGIGILEHKKTIGPESIKPGDALIVNGDLGRHGICVMAQREGLEFESPIESDSAPLASLVLSLLARGIQVHALRDLTRGGLGNALNELASSSKLSMEVDEASIQVQPAVQGACEMLGLDPLYVANEGRFALFVPQEEADKAVALLKSQKYGENSTVIGRAITRGTVPVVYNNRIGTRRVLDWISGEQLPRIC